MSNGALLGVLQVINRLKAGPFTELETDMVSKLAAALGEKVRQELQSSSGPYDYLVQSGRVSQRDLDDILHRSVKEKQTVSLLLMREKRLSEAEIGEALEHFYQIPYMPYDPALVIPHGLVQGIKKSYLRSCGWLPVSGDHNEVKILIDDPSDSAKLGEIQRLVNAKTYHFKIGLPEDLLRYLGQEVAILSDENANTVAFASPGAGTAMSEVADATDPSAAVALVKRMLLAAQLARATDIHIEPAGGSLPTTVRFRVDGSCVVQEEFADQLHPAVMARIKSLANLDVSAQQLPQAGKLSIHREGKGVEFRVASAPTVHGESMVLRLLTPPGARVMGIDELNLGQHNHGLLQKVLSQTSGLFLVAGPARSGKTTSVHALLKQLNTADRTIWTVEDPVEITHNGVQQIQTNPQNGFTSAAALRSVLLCDPDIVMVGDMRDPDTVNLCVDASLAGHLVFSSLHSYSAPAALARLMDSGVDTSSFADALMGVMYQRLVRKLCNNCKQPVQLTPEIQRELASLYGARFDEDCASYLGTAASLFRHGACKACQGTGFDGRMAIHELLVSSPALKRLISQGARLEQLADVADQAGMRTLIQDQIVKSLQGHLDIDLVRSIQ